jgi:hypothetical protein
MTLVRKAAVSGWLYPFTRAAARESRVNSGAVVVSRGRKNAPTHSCSVRRCTVPDTRTPRHASRLPAPEATKRSSGQARVRCAGRAGSSRLSLGHFDISDRVRGCLGHVHAER